MQRAVAIIFFTHGELRAEHATQTKLGHLVPTVSPLTGEHSDSAHLWSGRSARRAPHGYWTRVSATTNSCSDCLELARV